MKTIQTIFFVLIFSCGLAAQTVNRVQQATDSGNPIAEATFGAVPTAGNLLIAVTGVRSGGNNTTAAIGTTNANLEDLALNATTPTGWTKVVENYFRTNDGNRRGIAIFYKIAGAAEPTTVTTRWDDGATQNHLIIQEFTLVGGGTIAFDVAASSNTGTGAANNLSTGTTAATAQANSLIITGLMSRETATAATWTNDIANNILFNATEGAAVTVQSAYGVATVQGTKESTATIAENLLMNSGIVAFSLTPAATSASFTTTITPGSCTVGFDATPSISASGALTYAWDFDNDGNFNDGTGINPSFTFGSVGPHTVSLQVTDAASTTSSTSSTFSLNPTVAATFTTSNSPGSNTVIFNASASNAGPGATYNWNFGDATTSTQGPSVNHTYAATGTYNVTLTITTPCGGNGNAAQNVTTQDCTPSANLSFAEVANAAGANLGGGKDGGSAWADFNNDGCLDLIVNTTGQGTRIFQSDCNLPNPQFTDVTAARVPLNANNDRDGNNQVDILQINLERSAVWADLNNDGLPDFVRNSSTRIEIYINQGGPNFNFEMIWFLATNNVGCGANIINGSHLLPTLNGCGNGGGNGVGQANFCMNGEGVGFVDYDNDGFLDVILENHDYGVDIFTNRLPAFLAGTANTPFELRTCNNTAAQNAAAVPASNGTGLIERATDGDYMTVGDYNLDGYLDILARKRGNGPGPTQFANDLFTNNTNGTFTLDNQNFAEDADNGNKGGVAFCDFNADGRFDIVWTEHTNDGRKAVIWLQDAPTATFPARLNPDPLQALIADQGVGVVDGVACGDVDGDGYADLALGASNGIFLFRNTLPTPGGAVGFDFVQRFGTQNFEGINLVDYDGDGDLDLYGNVAGGNNRLWRNTTTICDYIKVEALQCIAPGLYREAIGATIEIRNPGGGPAIASLQDVNAAKGHGSQNPLTITTGIPNQNAVYQVFVRFPPYNVDLDGNGTIENPNPNGQNETILETFSVNVRPSDFPNNTVRISSFFSISGGASNCVEQLLPVQLANFGAFAQDDQVKVHWITVAEQNNSHFIVERSTNGEVFEWVARVNGKGNSQDGQAYAAYDPRPYIGHSYYRLRQVDLDGSEHLSRVVNVYFEPPAGRRAELTLLGNPVRIGTPIEAAYHAFGQERVQVSLHDTMGRTYFQKDWRIQAAGYHTLHVPTDHLTKGVYLLRFQTKAGLIVKKILLH
ncbi:MAG: PKD domain-containing protein [Bernardetiaceae bacterium]